MRIPISLVLGFLVFMGAPAVADTITLKNGDVLTGTLVTIGDGKVTLKTEAAGEVKVDLAQVATIATDAPITIHLKGGQNFNAKAVAAAAGSFTTEGTETLTAQTVQLDMIETVNPPAKPPVTWTGTITASSNWTRGNSSTQTTAIDINAVKRAEVDRISFDGWYRSGRQKDQATGVTSTTERRMGAAAKYDYFFGETKAYAYANASGEKDGIAALDLRFIAGAGAGYQFIESDTEHLNAEAGLAWFSENFSNNTPSSDEIALRTAYHYDRTFAHDLSIFNDVEAYKVFSGPRDYFVKAKAGVRDQFTASFLAQAWVEFNWDSTPANGKERTDVFYYLGVGWAF